MFINYSQTYASAITTLAGFLVIILARFGVDFVAGELEFALGAFVNAIGVVWTVLHRFGKGDVTALGARK